MKTIYKKNLTGILLGVLILTLLASCKTNTDGGINENITSGDLNQNIVSENDTEQEQEEVKINPDLPEAHYDGYEFTVLSMTNEQDYERDDFFAEEFIGEVINDAKYTRNLYVEDKYGVSIKTVNIGNFSMNNGTNSLKKEISAGNTSYDVAVFAGLRCGKFSNGRFTYGFKQYAAA